MTIVFRAIEVRDLFELRSWFEDAELSRRIAYPTDAWFAYVTGGNIARCWTAHEDCRTIATLQIDQDGQELAYQEPGYQKPAYLDVVLRPDLRGQGIGRTVLASFLAGPGSIYPVIEGRIEPDNVASLRCCRSCGFDLSDAVDEEGFIRAVYRKVEMCRRES